MSKSEEYLNLDRYVDEKIFTKVTGKSLFKDYETILEGHKKKLWEKEQVKRKAEAKRRIEEQKKLFEEKSKKKAYRVGNKKDLIEEPKLGKHNSQMPKNTGNLDGGKMKHLNTLTDDKAFKAEVIGDANNEVDKVVVKPVGKPTIESREVPISVGVSSESRDIPIVPDSPDNGDNIPLLFNRQLSDHGVDDEEYADFGLNDGRKSEYVSDEIKELVRLDNQRTESMYDIMMKKEESIKGPESSRNNTETNLTVEEEKSDKKNKSAKTSFSKSVKTSKKDTNVGLPKYSSYTGEPMTTTTCFGGCMNWVTGIFRRD
jgi:hypothetical protein